MKLKTLKARLQRVPSKLASLTTQNLDARPAGRTWQETRLRIQVRDGSMCGHCGKLWMPGRDVVDHRVPRWAGGSDEDRNLWLLHSDPCHAEKTECEARMRAGGGWLARPCTCGQHESIA